MTRKNLKKNIGFTLVETLVAISILSLSILAAFTAVQSGLSSSTIAKDQITAFFLTQEAMEYIKNVRDQNALLSLDGTSVSWMHSLAENASDPCYFGKTCTIDSPLRTVASCSGGFGSCPVLRQDSSSGLYGYTAAWTATSFKREIQFQSLSADEIKVTVALSWTTEGRAQSFQISELLFNRE